MFSRIVSLSLSVLCGSVGVAVNDSQDVHLMVDASGSVEHIEPKIDSVMTLVKPAHTRRYQLWRWDERLLPHKFSQTWPVAGNFYIRRVRKQGGTELAPSLRGLLKVTRSQVEECTRIIVVVHGLTASPQDLRAVVRSIRTHEFLRILMIPMVSPENDPDTDLQYYRNIAAEAGAGDVAAMEFSEDTFQAALDAAEAHGCLPFMV